MVTNEEMNEIIKGLEMVSCVVKAYVWLNGYGCVVSSV